MLWTDWLSFTKGKLSAFRDVKDHEKLYQEATLALEEAVGQIIGYPPSAAPILENVIVQLCGNRGTVFANKRQDGFWVIELPNGFGKCEDCDIVAWWHLPSYRKDDKRGT